MNYKRRYFSKRFPGNLAVMDLLNKIENYHTKKWVEEENIYPNFPKSMSTRKIIKEIYKRLQYIQDGEESLSEMNAEIIMSGVCSGYTRDNIETLPNTLYWEKVVLTKMLDAIRTPKPKPEQKPFNLKDLPF